MLMISLLGYDFYFLPLVDVQLVLNDLCYAMDWILISFCVENDILGKGF